MYTKYIFKYNIYKYICTYIYIYRERGFLYTPRHKKSKNTADRCSEGSQIYSHYCFKITCCEWRRHRDFR